MSRTFFKGLFLAGCAALAVPAVAQELRSSFAETRPAAKEQAGFIDQETLLSRLRARDPDLVVVDVRTPEEYAAGHIEGALNIAYDQLPARGAELAHAKHKDIVLYCRSGRRTAIAVETLHDQGFARVLHLDGDMLAWHAARRPLSTSAPAQPHGSSAEDKSTVAQAPGDEEPKL